MLDALLAELHEQIDDMARLVADGDAEEAERLATAHDASLRQALLLHGQETDPVVRTRGAAKLVQILEMQGNLLAQARLQRDIVATQLRELGRAGAARRAYGL